MTKTFHLLLVFACAIIGFQPAEAQEKPELVVYTYDSLTASWGLGPILEAGFERDCNCDLRFVDFGSAATIITRAELEGEGLQADILLGFDQNLMLRARTSRLLAYHGLEPQGGMIQFQQPDMIAYDHGQFAFIYDATKLEHPPGSLRELVENPDGPTILIQDPRTSTPGFGLTVWMKAVFQDQAHEAWKKLAPRIVSVTQSWSEAYGAFLEGEADMVLSYTTSPAYHELAEQDVRYKAARFLEGHSVQIELAAITRTSTKKALARSFLQFLQSAEIQAQIATTQWMLPVQQSALDDLPSVFTNVADWQRIELAPEQVQANRNAWIDEWQDALSKGG